MSEATPRAFARADSDAVWRPGPDELANARLARFVRATGEPSLDAVQARAIADPGWFWSAAADDLGIDWQRRPTQVLDLERGVPWARWWRGGAFNYASAAVDRTPDPDREAVAWEGEDGEVRRLTRAELRRSVDRAAAMLAANGVEPGSRVAIYLPMQLETVVAVLALGKLQAIYTPIFSGYAAPAVASRLRAFEATHLITADGFYRRGTVIPLKTTADEALRDAPSVRRVLVVERIGGLVDLDRAAGRDRWWHEAVAEIPADRPWVTAETDPETPYMVIYTSGTTGAPKGTVHVHGGFPVKGAQDLAHTFDLGSSDALFWFTDLGWMMGPWAISGSQLLGARLVIYEGAPDYPGPDRIWSIVARHRVTHLGVSPTLVRALIVHGTEPVRAHDLSSLRVLGSTGEPWNADPWLWYFNEVGGGRLPIINYSGGTEIAGGIVGCNLLRPIRATSFNGPCPGMGVDVVDPAGASLRGEVGELVIRTPWPGMTRGFWGADEERYIEAYWRRMPGLWVHGDWAYIDDDGYWYLLGRSDDTLKVAGKRVGPAEVETAAVSHPLVVEAAAIGQPDDVKGETIVVLAVLRPGAADGPALEQAISDLVVRDLGKTCRPSSVVAVPDLPRTRSGKIMRRVARAAWLGVEPGDLTALENPAAVEAIAAVRAARSGGAATGGR